MSMAQSSQSSAAAVPLHATEEIECADNSWNIHAAAQKGDHEELSRFRQEHGVEKFKRLLRSENKQGLLPLHCAARNGHMECLPLLLPVDEDQDLAADPVNHVSERNAEGWSALHFAAKHNHACTLWWLLDHGATVNLQDRAGNTPLHLAVPLGSEGASVVLNLVENGADLFIRNKQNEMPISLYNDPSLFGPLFYKIYTGQSGTGAGSTEKLPADGKQRNILHYVAQVVIHPLESDELHDLIAKIYPNQRWEKDIAGDSFLDVAAKSGNTDLLRVPQILEEPAASPLGDCINRAVRLALSHDQGNFFKLLIYKAVESRQQIKLTLKDVVKLLLAELIDKPEIQARLPLFASTLPTYLALYANKNSIFNFLLESKCISVNQWDEEQERTCLHWAVIDKRADIVHKLCKNGKLHPGIQDKDGKTALQHAAELNDEIMVKEILSARPEMKDYEEKLYKDRDVHVQGLNAILVGAALIASIAFAGWLQWPPTANFHSMGMKIFWASNSVSFFTAVATMCVTTATLLPVRNKYVGDTVKKLRFAIVVDAGLLALSLAAVMCAFAAVGFAAVEDAHMFSYQAIMRASTAVGGFLCLLVWLVFEILVYKSAPPMRDIVALMPSWADIVALMPSHRVRQCLYIRLLGDSSKSYSIDEASSSRSLSSDELIALMEKDLVPTYKLHGVQFLHGVIETQARVQCASPHATLIAINKKLNKILDEGEIIQMENDHKALLEKRQECKN